MIKWAYIRLVWRNNRTFALFSMVFITLFQFLILYLVTTFDTAAILSAIMEQLPPMIRAFMQDSFFSMLNYDGAAAFGLNHPIVLTLLVITAINIPAHHISRELETGTLELLLAHPFRRNSLLLSLWLAGSLIIMTIIATALIGSCTSIILFHDLTRAIFGHLLEICLNLWLLITLIFTYTLLIAVFGRTGIESGKYQRRDHLFILPAVFPGPIVEHDFFHQLLQHLQLLPATKADAWPGELFAGCAGAFLLILVCALGSA